MQLMRANMMRGKSFGEAHSIALEKGPQSKEQPKKAKKEKKEKKVKSPKDAKPKKPKKSKKILEVKVPL